MRTSLEDLEGEEFLIQAWPWLEGEGEDLHDIFSVAMTFELRTNIYMISVFDHAIYIYI